MPDRLRRPILRQIDRDFDELVAEFGVAEINRVIDDNATTHEPPSPDDDHAHTTATERAPDNAYLTFDQLAEFSRRVMEQSETTPGSRLQLFTIRETATIIEESYHTTRNMALRGEFGELAAGESDTDTIAAGATYITREGLLAYLRRQAQEHEDISIARYQQIERLTCGETSAREIDVTDEAANTSQAFQNIASAFAALATVATEHHSRSEDMLRGIITETTRTRERVEDLAEVPTSTQLSQTLDTIATEIAQIRTEMRRRLPSITITGAGGAGGVTSPTTAAQPIPWSSPPPLREPAESFVTPASESPTPDEIPADRPDQIVEVSDHARWTRHSFRTRRAVGVGDLICLDGRGDIRRASAGETALVVVVSVRDAVPDASETIQRLQTYEMWNNDRAEILHPWRDETSTLITNQAGLPDFVEHPQHFRIVSWDAAAGRPTDRRRVTIQWRAS